MPITREEEVVLLYTLYTCGKKPSKGRAIEFILSNELLRERDHDMERVATGEPRIENRIAWTRQNLKDKGQLSMPDTGIWAITPAGTERIEKVAVRSLEWEDPNDPTFMDIVGFPWDRFSTIFLQRLREMGTRLKEQKK
jgi:hypothetical protein